MRSDISDALTSIAACLCVQIEEDAQSRGEESDFCFCGVIASDTAFDMSLGDCHGFAYVRLVSIYPSSVIGVADVQPGNCGKGIGVDVEVAIFRPMEVPEANEVPTAEEWLDAVEAQSNDALLIMRALNCCTAVDSDMVIMGTALTAGPEGGLVGVTWPVSLMIERGMSDEDAD